jgi:hypothetical protein
MTMLLWLACFGAACLISEAIAGIIFWIIVAIRYWWVIAIGALLYYLWIGVSAVWAAIVAMIAEYPALEDYLRHHWWIMVLIVVWHMCVVPWWRRGHPAPAQVAAQQRVK